MDFNRTATSTPSSSPGLFSSTINPIRQPLSSLSDGTPHSSPYLHPLQMHRVRETHKAQVEQDFITGRKLINQYEIINEIGRGVHGKVKLARSLQTQEYVAIKIIQRFSKKRKLGKVTVSPEDKTKREIAILKKIRHANVVGLLEVIDDPELKKIYMVLEHVELGEIVWRRKGATPICLYERRRVENEQRGEKDTSDVEKYVRMLSRRLQRIELQRTPSQQLVQLEHWSLEHGVEDEGDLSMTFKSGENTCPDIAAARGALFHSASSSRLPSRTQSRRASVQSSRVHTPPLAEYDDIPTITSEKGADETPGPLPSIGSNLGSASALNGLYYSSYPDDIQFRDRSPSMAESIISHVSSFDDIPQDAYEDDFSYVPCFTIDQARSAFRDTVLGLEYLHYEGIVHRDIKPANLLWTRDHRVKISDFGVSYFGRPIRDGDADAEETDLSEADASDFDDDLELSKTVGTPAFFAPELCYTDIDVDQPKVNEQIDIWSLGITLYCLIFARIPFLAEDEYQLFRCIAKEEVYIPRRRLKAVDSTCNVLTANTIRRAGSPNNNPYREEDELAYEEIDDELYDLLRRMLIKDPTERINLREVKRHPWVLRGLDNFIGWLDDSDPARRAAGRKIQVDSNELERAVVPINFLERARSAVKKAVGKVISVTRSETGSRRRAASSAASSGTDNHVRAPITPLLRDSRRSSVRGDESYVGSFPGFGSLSASFGAFGDYRGEPTEHPLSQSLTASPEFPSCVGDPFELENTAHQSLSGVAPPCDRVLSAPAVDPDVKSDAQDRNPSIARSLSTFIPRTHTYSRSVTTPISGPFSEEPSIPFFTDHLGAFFGGHLWGGARKNESLPDIKETILSRVQSVDRNLFESENKHGEPSVALTPTTAPGVFQYPIFYHPHPMSQPTAISPVNLDKPLPSLPSPLLFQHETAETHQSASSLKMHKSNLAASNLDDRPSTATKSPEGKALTLRGYGSSTPESYQRAREANARKKWLEAEADAKRQQLAKSSRPETFPTSPLSPDDDVLTRSSDILGQPYRPVSSNHTAQFASLSELNSPTTSAEQPFPSVPSLPALISGGSSVSADTEGEGLRLESDLLSLGFNTESTSETGTSPLLTIENSIEVDAKQVHKAIFVATDGGGYIGDGDAIKNNGNDSDSDEGLTMMKPKPKAKRKSREHGRTQRRNTNTSVGSDVTAKKVTIES